MEGGLGMPVFYRRLPKFQYISSETVDDALSCLVEYRQKARLIAGGTDLIPQLKRREIPIPEYVIDIKGIPGLEEIRYDPQFGLKIGALATMSSIERSPVLQEHFPILVQAASSMASPQIRNRGTFGGNICNAVPSADSAPALLAMGAKVVLQALTGVRMVSLEKFFTGPRATVIREDEMLVHILVPKPDEETRGIYLKLSPRHSMDLAVVGVAVAGSCKDGTCTDVKIGLGAVAPTPIRATGAEEVLRGRKVFPEVIDQAARSAMDRCSPRIDSNRASPEYRRDMVYVLTRRALRQVLGAG
jgi:carbon-monoxide dehydrogenase medium subunit